MFRLIKLVFSALLSFSGSSAITYVSLNNKPCMIRSTPIDFNSAELNYYPFMVSLGKCSESLNSIDDWYTKIWILTETKGINVNLFNMITKSNNEAKIIVKHTSCDWKCEFSSSICNSYQKWNNDKFQWECKKYCTCKNDYTWNPSASICDNGKYLKTFIDDSNCVWWYYIRYKYCVSKCHEYSFNKFWS